MNKLLGVALLAVVGWFGAGPALAQALECGSVYTVKKGDSLSKIARRVYGRTSAYQPIFDFNPSVLSNPNQVPAGVDLYLPCIGEGAGGTGTEEASPLPVIPEATSNRLRVLTGSEYPPYVDEGLPNGGFSVELVERALLANGGASNYRVDVINDWSSHLSPLLEDGAYDLAFPWFKPDCSKRSSLGESSVWRCDKLRFSEPLHEVVIAFYARRDQADTFQTVDDFKGTRICRPRGYFTHDIEAMGLVADSYQRLAPGRPMDCFAQLAAGTADIVTVNADTADQIVTGLGIGEEVIELVDFATVQTLHVVATKGNPRGRVDLMRVNQGLRQLQLNGEFRKIATTHLSGG